MSARRPAASSKLLTGLIGAPIAHSASPAMHERAAEALGLRGHYQLIEVAGVAVIGAGGVGKAIAFALASRGVADIRIYDNEPARAEKLASLLPAKGARVASSVADALDGATGVVNATPVGMLPNRGTPVEPTLLHEGLWVADAVYSPLITPLLAAAQATGARIMTGRELAIYQAADAFELFSGLLPSTEVMGEAFDRVMAERGAAYQAA
jgi:shikimate dehydrogenase